MQYRNIPILILTCIFSSLSYSNLDGEDAKDTDRIKDLTRGERC